MKKSALFLCALALMLALAGCAANTGVASAGDGTATIRKGRNLFTSGLPLRQLLLDACSELGKAGQPLRTPSLERFTFTPEIFQAIKERKLKG